MKILEFSLRLIIALSFLFYRCTSMGLGINVNYNNGDSSNKIKTKYLKLYPSPNGLPQDVKGVDHSVWINHKSCFVYRTEATGHAEYGSVYPEYVYFDFSGLISVKVKANYTVKNVVILPSRANISPIVNGNDITFTIDKPGQYFVKINGDADNGSSAEKNLYIFANPPEVNVPDEKDPNVVFFKPGVYADKYYQLKSNKTYYIAGGAFVYGRFYGSGLKNVTIRGRGIICGEHLTSMGDEGRIICIKKQSDNIKIEGINIMHPKVWTVAIYQSNHIHINNIHTISHGMSSDGCDITGCHYVMVESSFFRAHDDILAVKSHDFGHEMSVPQSCEHITFRNCVVWCDSSNPMTIGYETNQDIKNILYENIDVINMSRPPVWRLEAIMAIEPHNEGIVDSVTYRNIRIDVKVPQNSLFRFVVDNGTGRITNINIDNVWVNYGGTLGGIIYGTPQADVSNITFNNIRNNKGLMLATDKITSNSYAHYISLFPQAADGTKTGEVWDISTEFSGFSNNQGRFNWYYKSQNNNEEKELTWNNLAVRWDDGDDCYIAWDRTDRTPYRNFPQMAARFHPNKNRNPILVWRAPIAGEIEVTGKVSREFISNGDSIYVSIKKNNQDAFWDRVMLKNNHLFIDAGIYDVNVLKGDEIKFIAKIHGNNKVDNIEWNPVIEYISVH